MFGMMFTIMYVVAIASGLVGQAVADAFQFAPIAEDSIIYTGGFCAPFDVAIICLLIGMSLMSTLWKENYGGNDDGVDSTGLVENIKNACSLLVVDKRMLLLGGIVAAFEGSMFAFVFNWTPVLASKTTPPPHGLIFAMFMMACMCGASTSTMLGSRSKASQRLMAAFGAGFLAFSVASHAASGGSVSLMTSFAAFLVFEFCCGLYFPSIGVVKSEVVPEYVRGTMYNLYRVPLNAIVVVLLLTNISTTLCFRLCGGLMVMALMWIFVIDGPVLVKAKVEEEPMAGHDPES